MHGRELVRARGAWLRPVGHDRFVATRIERRAHAATSASSDAPLLLVGRQRHIVCREALGQVGQDDPVVGSEDGRGDLADRLRRDREVARQHLVDEVGLVEEGGVHRQAVGPLFDALEGAQLVGLGQRLGAGELVVGHQLGRQAGQLLVQGSLDASDRDPRPDGRPAGRHRRAADEPEGEDGDVLGDLLVADEPPVEPAALATRQDLPGEVERIEPRVAEDRGPVAHVDARQRDLVVDRLATFTTERRRERQVAERRDVRAGRDGPEVALGRRPDVRGLDIADHRQDGVVRRVVGPEEGAHVLDRRGVEVVHRADGRVMVRMLRREEVGLELLLERAVRAVVVRPALLVLDDLALVVEVLLAQGVEQGRHPVGLEPEGQFELVRRQRLEVVRAVEPGRAVHGPAGGLHERDVFGLRDVARALEHDMLEQVREAGLAGDLVLGADVVPEVDRHDRCEMILRHDDPQAVGETLVTERDLGNGGGHG